MHLNAEDLVDIAEGTRPESSAPHLATCEPCRAQLRELRAMMSEAGGVGVPEPSPLFWDHLSRRVSEAVAAENARLKPSRYDEPSRDVVETVTALFRRRWVQATVGIAAVLLVSFVAGSGPRAPVVHAPSLAVDVADVTVRPGPPIEFLRDVSSNEDVSLMMVASLTDEVDLDTAREAGLATRGSAENAVAHMNETELRELGRLLKAELARSGA
jgi:hypothetical protein